MNSNHKADDRFFCPDCCKCLSAEEELIEHQNTEHGNKKALTHTCDICGQEFYFKYKLDEHMYIHTGRKAHGCDKCSERFVSRKELDRHVAEHSQEVSFHCNTCDKTFGSIDQLQRHVKLHTGHGKYPCSICGASFRWKSQLSSHMVVHSQDFDFICGVCNKQFKRKRDLTRHVKIYHDTKPPYTCFECNKDFHSPFNLHKHKSETHWKRADAEDFPCRHCSGYFRFKKDLIRHEAKVHPPRPFVCTICQKRFTMMKFLEKHFELHHEDVVMIEGESYTIVKTEKVENTGANTGGETGEPGSIEQVITEEFHATRMEIDGTGDTNFENGSEPMFVVENVDTLTNGELLSQLKQAGEANQITVTEAEENVYQTSIINQEHLENQQPISEAITLAHLSEQQTVIDPTQELVPMIIENREQMEVAKQPVPQVIHVSTNTAPQTPKAQMLIPKVVTLPQPTTLSVTQPQVIKIQPKSLPATISFSPIGVTNADGGHKVNKVYIQRKVLPVSSKANTGGNVKILSVSGGQQTGTNVTPAVTSLTGVSTALHITDNTIIAGMVPTTAEDLVSADEVVEQAQSSV